MSGRPHDGGPAFPFVFEETNEHGIKFPFAMSGMTLCDWFAGQALGAMEVPHYGDFSPDDHRSGRAAKAISWRVEAAFAIADAMLAERAKRAGGAS